MKRGLSIFLFLLIIAIVISGCSAQRVVTVEHTIRDTLWRYQLQYDSVFVLDSVSESERTSGDTVYKKVDRWHTVFRDRLRADSAHKSHNDSMSVPVPTEKRVPANLNWHQKARIWIGNIVLLAMTIFIGVRLLRIYIRRRVGV